MKNQIHIYTWLSLLGWFCTNTMLAQEISHPTFTSAGGTLNGSSLSLVYSIGEPNIGVISNGTTVTLGFLATVTSVGILSIPELESSQLKLYPNPVKDYLFVQLPKEIQRAKVLVYNLQGQKMGEYAITQNQMGVNLTVLKRGVYIIMIQMDDQLNYFKILKE